MASIKLQGDTSGELTISAPAVAGTNTLTLPASTGTVLTDTAPKAGNILQVVQGTLTTSFSTTSTSYVNLVTVAITPTSTASKIYVSFTTNSGTNGDVNHNYMAIFRDATEIGSATVAGSRTSAQAIANTGAGQQFVYAGSKLDSPNSISAITYAVKVKTPSGVTAYFNRSARDTDGANYDGRSVSQITVMEVAG